MKKTIFMSVMLAVLASCEKVDLSEIIEGNENGGENNTEVAEYTKNFHFSIKGDFLNPEFHEGTRAASSMTADGAEMTDLWVVDVIEGEIKQQLHQTNTDTDWGKPSMALTLGTHHVMFLASRGTTPNYQNGVVTWAKPLDTFYTDYEVTVVKTSNGNRSVTLDRVSTKLVLNMTDAIPTGTTELRFLPVTWYTGYDMLNGTPVANTEYEQVFSIPASWQGNKNASFTSWSLSTSAEWTTNLNYQSYAGTTKNGEITIIDAPFKANRSTTYHGKFYTEESESNVSLNGEWLPAYEGVY